MSDGLKAFVALALLLCFPDESFSVALPSHVGLGGSHYANRINYDPSTRLISLSGSGSIANQINIGGSMVFPTIDLSSYALFAMIDQSGQASGGVFTMFGSAPELGIDTNSLLIAAAVTSAGFSRNYGGSPPTDNCGGYMRGGFGMQASYVHPKFGLWGQYLSLVGPIEFIYPECHAGEKVITDDILFEYQWAAGVADYYDLYGSVVPEPGTLALLGLGLAGLGMSRRRKAN